MAIEKINFDNEITKLKKPRIPLDIVRVNDHVIRAVICEGTGKWYVHDYDEFFLGYKGEVIIETRDSSITLKNNEGVLIPKGVEHRTSSSTTAIFLVFRHHDTMCKVVKDIKNR